MNLPSRYHRPRNRPRHANLPPMWDPRPAPIATGLSLKPGKVRNMPLRCNRQMPKQSWAIFRTPVFPIKGRPPVCILSIKSSWFRPMGRMADCTIMRSPIPLGLSPYSNTSFHFRKVVFKRSTSPGIPDQKRPAGNDGFTCIRMKRSITPTRCTGPARTRIGITCARTVIPRIFKNTTTFLKIPIRRPGPI